MSICAWTNLKESLRTDFAYDGRHALIVATIQLADLAPCRQQKAPLRLFIGACCSGSFSQAGGYQLIDRHTLCPLQQTQVFERGAQLLDFAFVADIDKVVYVRRSWRQMLMDPAVDIPIADDLSLYLGLQ